MQPNRTKGPQGPFAIKKWRIPDVKHLRTMSPAYAKVHLPLLLCIAMSGVAQPSWMQVDISDQSQGASFKAFAL
jgi:hypothetical protein